MRAAYKYRTWIATSVGLLVAAVDKGASSARPEDCQPLVATVVSRVLSWFPLAT